MSLFIVCERTLSPAPFDSLAFFASAPGVGFLFCSPSAAAEAFVAALGAARSIGAKGWEIRGAGSLARRLGDTGQRKEGGALLWAACEGLDLRSDLADSSMRARFSLYSAEPRRQTL